MGTCFKSRPRIGCTASRGFPSGKPPSFSGTATWGAPRSPSPSFWKRSGAWSGCASPGVNRRIEATLMTKTSLEKARIKILLLEGIHPSAADRLAADGYTNIEHHPKSLSAPELEGAAADAYFIGIRSATQLERAFFDKAPRLIGVGCF